MKNQGKNLLTQRMDEEIGMKREAIDAMIDPVIYMNKTDFKEMEDQFKKDINRPEVTLKTFTGISIETLSTVPKGEFFVADKHNDQNSIMDRFWYNSLFGTDHPLSFFQKAKRGRHYQRDPYQFKMKGRIEAPLFKSAIEAGEKNIKMYKPSDPKEAFPELRWDNIKNKGEGLAAQIETKELEELTPETFTEFIKRYTLERNRQRKDMNMIEQMYHKITPTRPLKKIPMRQMVIDANNDVYNYYIVDGKVHYDFDCSAFPEKLESSIESNVEDFVHKYYKKSGQLIIQTARAHSKKLLHHIINMAIIKKEETDTLEERYKELMEYIEIIEYTIELLSEN